jgi:hypothetical protein
MKVLLKLIGIYSDSNVLQGSSDSFLFQVLEKSITS